MTNQPTPSPEDRFNAYLDALASGRSTPDASDTFAATNADPSMPAETARELHALARAADASEGNPPDSIWENIMNAGVAAPSASPHPIEAWQGPKKSSDSSARPNSNVPAERRTRPGSGAVRRASGWLNAVAAAVLLLGLFAGWYFSAIGPGGSGGSGDDGYLAALPAMQDGSPVATPTTIALLGPEDCTVEPLTVDEVMAIVENPNTRIDELGLPALPSGTHINSLEYLPRQTTLDLPTNAQFPLLKAAADTYLTCLQHGTMFQLWAVMYPEAIQQAILERFPGAHDKAAVRSFIELIGPKAPLRTTLINGTPKPGYTATSSDSITSARVSEPLPGGITIGYMGVDTWRDRDGALVAATDWNGNITLTTDDSISVAFPGGLAFAYYPDADLWLYLGAYRDPNL